MIRVLHHSAVAVLGLAVTVGIWYGSGSTAWGQTSKSKAKPKPVNSTEVKKLDARLDEIQRSFLNDTASLIKGYEDAGQYDRAKMLLEVLLKLDPKNDEIKKKIDKLEERALDVSEFEIDIDPSKPWQSAGIVTKDRPIRLEAEGDYKFTASVSVGPEGVTTKDPANDLIGGVPLGALIGVIVPPGAADSAQHQNAKPPNPFLVGSKFEQTAKIDGMLLIKVNVPPGSKCTGKLKLKVSGVTKA